MAEHDKVEGRVLGEQPDASVDSPFARLINTILIWIMLSLAQTVLTMATVLAYVLRLVNNGEPNDRLAEFGTDLGIWVAKAARYQTGASEVKPWPWTDID